MSYLTSMTTEDLLAVLAYRRATFEKFEADAKRSNLRSDRGLADEAYTSMHEAQMVLKGRGVDV